MHYIMYVYDIMYSIDYYQIKDTMTKYDVKPIRIKNKSSGITCYPSFIDFYCGDNDDKISRDDVYKKKLKDYFGNEHGKICVFVGYFWYAENHVLARRNNIDDEIELYDHAKYCCYDDFVDGYDVLVNDIDVMLQMIENDKKNISDEELQRKSKIKMKLRNMIEKSQQKK